VEIRLHEHKISNYIVVKTTECKCGKEKISGGGSTKRPRIEQYHLSS